MGKKLHLVALPLAAAAVAALAAPAQAAEGYDRCQDGYYCMFSGFDGTGDIIQINTDTPDLAVLGMAKRGKSDWNRTDSWIHLFEGTGYTGCSAVTAPRDKGNFYIDFRDYFESVRFDGPNGQSCQFSVKSGVVDSHG